MVVPEPVRVGGKLDACCVGGLYKQRRKAWKPAFPGDTLTCRRCGLTLEYKNKAWQAEGWR